MTHLKFVTLLALAMTTLGVTQLEAQTPELNASDPYQSFTWPDLHMLYLVGRALCF